MESMILATKSGTPIIGQIAVVMGWIMNAIYKVLEAVGIQNLGLCIIIFSILIYLCMTPLQIKQQKFSKLSAIMQPEIQKIQKGFKKAVEEEVKSERMKTELITNVSHDIKTPLTSIINYVDLLKRENPEDPKIRGYLEVLENKAQRLKVLTEDVVEASKASTGNIALEMTDLNFIELVHQVIGEFEEKFEERNLKMVVHFDEEEAISKIEYYLTKGA